MLTRTNRAAAAVTVLALSLAGCAENRYCATPQAYEVAPSVPAIQSVGDIKVAPAPDAYLIPAVPANPIPFGRQIPDPKKTRWSCLDQPPVLSASTATTSTVATPLAKP